MDIKALTKIQRAMEKNAKNSDYEIAHGDADYLLCELVEMLAVEQATEARTRIRAIMEAYGQVRKWYA